LSFKTALDGAYATWLLLSEWELQSQPICSHSEYYYEGACRMCPSNQFGKQPNDPKCYPCNLYSSTGDSQGMNAQQRTRHSFLCNRRAHSFKPIQSGAQINSQNKYSLAKYRRD